MQKKIWTEEYSVGVEEIDKQHQQIFSIANDIFDLVSSGVSEAQLSTILNSLMEYKKKHFETEEKYFEKFNYEFKDEHIKNHQKFSSNIEDLKLKYSGDPVAFAFKLVDFIEDWLIGHIMIDDKKYMKCFAEHGLK